MNKAKQERLESKGWKVGTAEDFLEDIMTIPVYEEPAEMQENTGVYEVCVFCRKPTKFWHKGTNNPVCQKCSKEHKVSELHNWRKSSSGHTSIE